MNDLKQLIFWIGCLMVIWLYMSNIGVRDLINAPVTGAGKFAETTIDKWIEVKQNNKFNPNR